MNIFMMDGLHRQEDCMRHCQKLGGRSPPVNTLQQWLAMQSEIEAAALEEVNLLPDIWLSVTEGDLKGRLTRLPNWPTTEWIEGEGEVPLIAREGVWRDYYTGARASVLTGDRLGWKNDTLRGAEYNCMTVDVTNVGISPSTWVESECMQASMS